MHNDTLRILRFAIDEFIGGETTAKANEFMDVIMERLFQYKPEPTIGGAPPSPLPEHLAKGTKKVQRARYTASSSARLPVGLLWCSSVELEHVEASAQACCRKHGAACTCQQHNTTGCRHGRRRG